MFNRGEKISLNVFLALWAVVVCFLLSTTPAHAQTFFSDDFEGNLSQWVGKYGGAHHGKIVEDPIRPGNHILTFTQRNSAGDIYGTEISVTSGKHYVLHFEYLGVPSIYGWSGNLGGFIGFSESTPGFHRWLDGTVLCCGAEDDSLIDDGQWHSYSIEFDPFVDKYGNPHTPSGNTIRVMLEDYAGSGGIAGDVYFDNILLTSVVVDVDIDIKPGSDPNSVNIDSRGVIPVAILTTPEFNAANVDPETVSFGPLGAWPENYALEDVDWDGDTDMIFHFKTRDAGIALEDTKAVLTGKTYDGLSIEGADSVKVLESRGRWK